MLSSLSFLGLMGFDLPLPDHASLPAVLLVALASPQPLFSRSEDISGRLSCSLGSLNDSLSSLEDSLGLP